MHRLLWPIVLLTIFLAGCAVHKPQRVAPVPVQLPETYIEQAEPAAKIPFAGEWWKAFNDPRLNDLVEEAFGANLEMDQAFARLEQSAAAIRTFRAAQLPALNVDGTGGERRQPGLFGTETNSSFSLSAAANYEIDLWEKLSSRTAAARLDMLATGENIKALYLTLSAQVAELYYLAVEQRAQLELSDRTIDSFADTLERVERRYREGLVPALDVYQARQNLAAARSRRPVFQNNLAEAEHALSVLIANYPAPGDGDELSEIPPAVELFPAGIPSRLLARRPDIEAGLLRLRASDARIAAAVADRFPAFNLTGRYGGASSGIGDVLRSGNITWNLLLNLAQPLLDGGRRKAEIDRTRAVFRESLAAYHQTVLTAFREVEDALSANRTSEERILRLEEQAEAAESALRLSMDRYLQGLSDFLPVLTAQSRFFDARSQLLTARRQLINDRIALARALGGQWMADEMEVRLADKGSET